MTTGQLLLFDWRTRRPQGPYKAVELGYIDEVIDPADTRLKIIQALRMLKTKRGHDAVEEAREYSPLIGTCFTQRRNEPLKEVENLSQRRGGKARKTRRTACRFLA